eukprot:scaffold43095_cov27-Tisochrysis_lutea.AAC.3
MKSSENETRMTSAIECDLIRALHVLGPPVRAGGARELMRSSSTLAGTDRHVYPVTFALGSDDSARCPSVTVSCLPIFPLRLSALWKTTEVGANDPFIPNRSKACLHQRSPRAPFRQI